MEPNWPEIYLDLEEGELISNPSDTLFEESSPSQGPCAPIFDNAFLLRSLLASQFSVDRDLVDGWSDADGFLSSRYGLRVLSDEVEHGLPQSFPMALGLCKGPVDLLARCLYLSVVESTPLPRECDLSGDYEPTGDGFPRRSPGCTLGIETHGTGYLVTVNGKTTPPWKLLVEDPLTVVQIEREGWSLQADVLVSNLVRKGLPFKVLYPSCQRGAFFKTPGPIVHPEGKYPTHADYMAYLLDVADFFKLNPYAHAAALCSGGILWRIAVDVLPLPREEEIVRPFHVQACTEHTANGQRYWTPKLTPEEEEVIVGVYKWAGEPSKIRRKKDAVNEHTFGV